MHAGVTHARAVLPRREEHPAHAAEVHARHLHLFSAQKAKVTIRASNVCARDFTACTTRYNCRNLLGATQDYLFILRSQPRYKVVSLIRRLAKRTA